MENREKVISTLEEIKTQTAGIGLDSAVIAHKFIDKIITLLKAQEEREKRICKEICDFIRAGCSTDTDDDKDFVCHEIQKCFLEGR